MSGITGILLAAGSARRFGSNKLLHPLLTGVPIAVTAARNLVAVLPRSIAVVRPGADELAALLRCRWGFSIALMPGLMLGFPGSMELWTAELPQ